MSIFIEGDKVILAPLTEVLVTEKYVSWLNNAEVTKYLEVGMFPATRDKTLEYVQSMKKINNSIFLAILDKQTKDHIGNIKLDQINWIHRTGEIGILIGDKDYWGKGYGSEATNLVVTHGFQTLNLRKISLGVYANHTAAIKSYEKVGFKIDGTMKKHLYLDGEYVDKCWMCIFHPLHNQIKEEPN